MVACFGESIYSFLSQVMRIMGGMAFKVPSEGIPLAPWDKMRAVLQVIRASVGCVDVWNVLLLLVLLFSCSLFAFGNHASLI